MCHPLRTLSHFLFNASFLSCLTLGDGSPFHNMFQTEVSSSHHLINMKFHSCLQFVIVRFLGSRRFLIVQCQHKSEVGQKFLVLICTIVPG